MLLTVFPVLICVSYILGMVNIDIVSLMDQLQPLLPEAALDVLEGDQKDLAATFATLDTIGEYNTAFMQLESGAVDAVACDLSIAQYQLAAKPDAYTQLDEPLSSEHYAVGFKKGDTKSADAVTESLKALYEDGTVKDLCDKYSSYGLSFDNWVLK